MIIVIVLEMCFFKKVYYRLLVIFVIVDSCHLQFCLALLPFQVES